MTYSEKLKDPRWQKKRLKVMGAADFKCQMCGDAEETLHVHHVNYRKGAKPWEYELHELRCFCEVCHKEVEGNIESARNLCSLIDHNHLNTILRCVHLAYFDSVSIGSQNPIEDTFQIALRDLKSRGVINIIKEKIRNGEKFDDAITQSEILQYLQGEEVE